MSDNEPLSTRAPRMRLYMRLIHELDSGAPGVNVQYSRNLDEVDLSDPEDVQVLAKGSMGPVLLHLGNEKFLPRFMLFLSNVQKWEQEHGKLKSVDLRLEHAVTLDPEMQVKAPPAKAAAAPPKPAPAVQAKQKPHKKRK
jgi:cell division protein FtsQ